MVKVGRKWLPRLNLRLTAERYNEITEHIDYGLRTVIFSAIIDDLTSLYHHYGQVVSGEVMSGRLKLRWEKAMTLEDMKASLSQMTDEEVIALVREVRDNRSRTVRKVKEKVEKVKGKLLVEKLTGEQARQLLTLLEGME